MRIHLRPICTFVGIGFSFPPLMAIVIFLSLMQIYDIVTIWRYFLHVEVIGTRLVARKRKGVFRRKTSVLEYRRLP